MKNDGVNGVSTSIAAAAFPSAGVNPFRNRFMRSQWDYAVTAHRNGTVTQLPYSTATFFLGYKGEPVAFSATQKRLIAYAYYRAGQYCRSCDNAALRGAAAPSDGATDQTPKGSV